MSLAKYHCDAMLQPPRGTSVYKQETTAAMFSPPQMDVQNCWWLQQNLECDAAHTLGGPRSISRAQGMDAAKACMTDLPR